MQTAVSVIVAVKNAADYLGEALDSVNRQDGVAVELLVVDGGSRDGSRALATRFGAKVIDQRGSGLSDAWNAGLDAATSPFVAFIDSDDVWTPSSLRLRLDRIAGAIDADICYGAVRHFAAVDGQTGKFPRASMNEDHVVPIPGTMLLRREIFDRIGPFDTGLALAGDADWIARALSQGERTVSLSEVVLLKRLHGSNLTRRVAEVQSELLSTLRRKIVSDRRAGR